MNDFVHLHVHTHYSLLDGLGKIPDLLDAVKGYEMNACAITDHGTMYGAIEFYKEAKKRGLRPIIGVEAYVAPRTYLDKTPRIDANPYHLILLAENLEGYKNLIKLTTLAHLEGYYYRPRIDKQLLARHHKGLIGLSACYQGEVPRSILGGNMSLAKQIAKEYLDIFGKQNFFLEVQHHPKLSDQKTINDGIFAIAKELDIPVVATNDTHYIRPNDTAAHEILLCVQTGKLLSDQDRMTFQDDLSLRSPQEMAVAFSEHPEVISNTQKIADRCELEIEMGKTIYPKFDLPAGFDNKSYLRKLCWEGMNRRFSSGESMTPEELEEKIDKIIIERLKYELSVIEKCGFEDYFLIVYDFVNWAKQQQILVGPGRGSAAGSLVSYVLNITDIDPIKYNLLFERFLNPDRIAPPDIDMDFADSRRGEVIQYVISKYGADHVAQIVTFGTMGARNAVRDTGRVLGMAYSDVDRIAKIIPQQLPLIESIRAVSEVKELYESDPEAARLLDLAMQLEGVARHASTHAAGVVIAPSPLVEYVPLQKAAGGDTSIVTQYEMGPLEAIGLLKMDFLGLSNLTILENALKIIKKVKDREVKLENLPLDDKKTYELLARGDTTGVFQLESSGMKRYLKELKPTSFEDIISMVALYRPGPMESIPDFIAGKHGKKKAKYLDPSLEPILKDTYGVIVTQDQVLQIARAFAGFTYAEADILRKAVGKKIAHLLAAQQRKFLDGAVARGASSQTAQQVWDFIEPFARYGFNRAHAACYAMIAYQTAYLKAHYPACFMAALLTSDQSNLDRIAIEISECQRLGIKVFPPDINESFPDFGVSREDGNIRFALAAIKNVGTSSAETIWEERKKGKFVSLENFVTRISQQYLNKKVIESLAKSGALDSMGERNQILASVEQIINYARSRQEKEASGQLDLFGGTSEDVVLPIRLVEVLPASKKQRLAWEKEFLGIYLSEHPLSEYTDLLRQKTRPISEFEEKDSGKEARVGGIISSVQKILTRNSETMAFIKLEDLSGSIELVVFPKVYQQSIFLWQEGKIIMIQGKLSTKDGQLKLLVDKAEELEPSFVSGPRDEQKEVENLFFVNLPAGADLDILEKIKVLLSRFYGDHEVVLTVPEGDIIKKIKTSFRVNASPELRTRIEEVLAGL